MSVYGAGASGAGMAPSMGYEPMAQQELGFGGQPYDQGHDQGSVMLPTQYPQGAAMNTFNGGTAFREPPSEAGGHASTHGGHDGGHEGGHGGHGHGEVIKKDTGETPRRCTDLRCCYYWLILVILAGTLQTIALQYGNMGRLTHGVDYYGRVCGVDPGVSNLPFLYWCRDNAPLNDQPTGLDLDRPSCVATCPASTNATVKIPCLQKEQTNNGGKIINGGQFGNVKTQVVMMQQSIVYTTPYATRARGGRYCIPMESGLEQSVLTDDRALGRFSANRALTCLGTLGHLYWLLFLTMLVTLGLSYIFLYCMKQCPRAIAYIFLGPLCVFTTLCALFFTCAIVILINRDNGFSQSYMPRNPLYREWDWQYGSILSLVIAVFLWLVSISVGGMMWNFDGVAISDLVHCAFECIKAVPCMWFLPMFEGLAKFVVFWIGLQGFRLLASEGYVIKNRIIVNGSRFAGLSRLFVPPFGDWRWYLCAIIWTAFTAWMMEVCTAFGQFVISYCTFKYYGQKKEKDKKAPPNSGTLCMGVRYGLIYHFGSILRAACVVPLWRPWRVAYWLTSEISGDNSEPKTFLGKAVNCISGLFCGCFGLKGCCGLETTSREKTREAECSVKDGLSDVVIRANDFDEGSVKAHAFLEHSHKIVQYLYRDLSQSTTNIMGVCGVSTICASLVYVTVANMDIYKDPASTLYISDPFLVTILAWILSAYITFGFMMLWDHCADTLLYCYIWSRKWDRKTVDKYIPKDLRFIVGFDDTENDRYPYYGRAKNNMYLRYWLPMVGAEMPKQQAVADKPKETKTATVAPTVVEPRPPPGRSLSEAQGSWMSGFGTGFGAWGRQEQAIGGMAETSPLMA